MKSLFKPLANMFSKKNDESEASSQEQNSSALTDQSNSMVQIDVYSLSKKYCDTFSAIQTVQIKLDKLLEAKEHIAEERFSSLHEQYRSFLDKHTPGLKKLSDEIDRRIEYYIADKKEAAEKFTEIKKNTQQEAKLLEVGVISKEDYIQRVQSFKPQEKEYKDKYKASQELITVLKDAKNNKYTPPPENFISNEENGGNQVDEKPSGQEDSLDKVKNKDKNYNMSQVYSDKDVDINMECGTNLNLKIEGIAIPITSNFVGTQKYEYLIITHPAPYTTVKPKLFTGNKISIESIFNGQLFIFSSPIIENLTKPIRAVVLEYPKSVSIKKIRTHERVTCKLPSTINFKGASKESIICDINPQGCKIEVVYQPTEKNYIARSDDNVKIEFSLPGDVDSYRISGVIKNVKKKELTILYGIQFTEVPEAAQKAI
ncbi:MAG: flagellar brake domain-containing protein, partial [Desulfamplus sp.]|nr:flagellar brake domain-containing protein [Desulfamplus sp.]